MTVSHHRSLSNSQMNNLSTHPGVQPALKADERVRTFLVRALRKFNDHEELQHWAPRVLMRCGEVMTSRIGSWMTSLPAANDDTGIHNWTLT